MAVFRVENTGLMIDASHVKIYSHAPRAKSNNQISIKHQRKYNFCFFSYFGTLKCRLALQLIQSCHLHEPM